jgi:hypothetical protein
VYWNIFQTLEPLTIITVYIDLYVAYKTKIIRYLSIVKPTRCTISQIYFILEQNSTCFGQSLRPSSGV